MFLSDEQNTSRDIIDNCRGDDDDIDDQPKDKPSNGYGPPTGSGTKKKITMLMKKKKEKKKENLCFTERYRSDRSCDDTATAGNNINPTNPNKVLFFPFNKPYKLFFKKSTPPPPPPNTAVASNACFPGKTSPGCFCFKRPPTLESSSTSTSTALQSQTSDPNHPNFTFDMLRSLIETNDFYSKECNPHSLDTTF